MKYFDASILLIIKRFYLMMAVIIVAFFAGVPWLSIVSLPILLSAMLGITFRRSEEKVSARSVKPDERRFKDLGKTAA